MTRTPRCGISLIEVLISIGVLALGLLGVAALFPVGSFYMLQAEVKDRSAAVAQQKFADLVDMGMLNPDVWLMDQNDYFASSLTAAHRTYTSVPPYTSQPSPAVRSQLINQNFGFAYVIDPLPIASSIHSGVDGPNNTALLSRFPIALNQQRPAYNALNPANSNWSHFTNGAAASHRLPARRVTFRTPLTGQALDLRSAETFFRSVDDTSVDLPKENNRPGHSLWETADLNGNNQQQHLARQFRGDYSWLATIVPTTAEGRNALLKAESSFLYDVSVVVFYKRVLGNVTQMMESEGLVRGHVSVTGTGGGEMILNVENTISGNLNVAKNLRVGHHVMVTGPHPESTVENPRLFLQWYRVLSIEEIQGFDNDSAPEYRVALRGPDWPWQPNAAPDNIANDLRIGIFPGAIAVHTKTMRLGGGAGGGGSGSPWDLPGPRRPDLPPPPWILL